MLGFAFVICKSKAAGGDVVVNWVYNFKLQI